MECLEQLICAVRFNGYKSICPLPSKPFLEREREELLVNGQIAAILRKIKF